MSKRKAIIELLIIFLKSEAEQQVLEVLRKNELSTVKFFSNGLLENKNSFWNFDMVETKTIFAILPISKTKDILAELETLLVKKTRRLGIAFTLPLDSASSNLVKIFDKKEKRK